MSKGRNYSENINDFSIVYELIGCSNELAKFYFYKLSSDDEVLSSVIEKVWCTSNFLNHFREANEQ